LDNYEISTTEDIVIAARLSDDLIVQRASYICIVGNGGVEVAASLQMKQI